jgi:cell division protein FtsB
MTLRWVLVVAIALGTIGLGYVFYEKAIELQDLQHEFGKIQNRQVVVLSEIENLQALFERKDDLNYIEYLARRELGLIYPDEVKYIIVGEDE